MRVLTPLAGGCVALHDETVSFDEAREQARHACALRSWAEAHEAYARADDLGSLASNDLDAWGLAAFLCGRDAESDAVRERAHYAYLADGDRDAAARVAFWLGLALTLRGAAARGGGWFARMHSVGTEDGSRASVWDGYEALSRGMRAIFSGDVATGTVLAQRAGAIAEQYADLELAILVRNAHGQGRIAAGELAAGLTELDEAMVLATTNDVSPQLTGLVSCAVINACRDCMDVSRSIEWTAQLSRWCEAQPGLVTYRGQCMVHRSELLQLRGQWREAMDEVAVVLDRLNRFPAEVAAGDAHYQRGELHRISGEYAEAELAFREALQRGRDPQPGLALLRLAQGRAESGLLAVSRALDEVTRKPGRTRLLAAAVEIALAAGDAAVAEAAAAELAELAAGFASPYLRAVAAVAEGAVALREGRAQEALTALRGALTCWTSLDAPYDAARCRVLIAAACRALGDVETADLERDAARVALTALCSRAEVERIVGDGAAPARRSGPDGLTPREIEVLRLLATGVTNRVIAERLFLSEKTVARHVANIFAKIDVSSRAAATAYAYAQGLA